MVPHAVALRLRVRFLHVVPDHNKTWAYKLTATNRQQCFSPATFCYRHLKCALPALPMDANTPTNVYQMICGNKMPTDDYETVQKALDLT
jgi:hypothetical protein